MSEAPKPRRPALEAVPALLVPGLLGAALGELGESFAPTALLLWLEPLILALGVCAALSFLFGGRPRTAFGLGLGLALMVVGARIHSGAPATVGLPPPWAQDLRGCALVADPVQTPVRLLLWTVTPGEPVALDALELDEVEADLVIITGTASAELGRSLGEALGGEVIPVPAPSPERDMLLAVRGAFQYCGGDDDHWILDAGDEAGGSRAVVSFPEIAGIGIVPLMAVRMSGPGGPLDWWGWPRRIQSSGDAISGLAAAMGSPSLVLAGDVHTPNTFSRLGRLYAEAGLRRVGTPPSWPARVGPLPMLTLHALDQVWAGGAWGGSESVAVPARGQSRAPVLVELRPPTARGPG